MKDRRGPGTVFRRPPTEVRSLSSLETVYAVTDISWNCTIMVLTLARSWSRSRWHCAHVVGKHPPWWHLNVPLSAGLLVRASSKRCVRSWTLGRENGLHLQVVYIEFELRRNYLRSEEDQRWLWLRTMRWSCFCGPHTFLISPTWKLLWNSTM